MNLDQEKRRAEEFLTRWKDVLEERDSRRVEKLFPQGEVKSERTVFPTHIPRQKKEEPYQPTQKEQECPGTTLQCDSVSASKTKCGLAAFDGSTGLYLTRTTHTTMDSHVHSWSTESTGTHPCPCDTVQQYTADTVRTESYNPSTCNVTRECEGTCTYDYDSIFPESCGEVISGETHQTYVTDCATGSTTRTRNEIIGNGGGTCCPFDFGTVVSHPQVVDITDATHKTITAAYTTRTGTSGSCHIDTRSGSCIGGFSGYNFVSEGTVNDLELSDEYTTALLKTKTEDALPTYAGFGDSHGSGQGTTCSATANLSSDETSYSIRRFKYRFLFSAVPPEGLIVNWTKRFTPAGVGSPTNTPMTWQVPPGYTHAYSDTFIQNEPASNGTTTIVGISTDCSEVPDGGTEGAYITQS